MTSSDNYQYVTVEVFRSELGDLRSEFRSEFANIHKEFEETHTEIQTVRDIALVNSAKIDAYRDSMTIWFTVLAIVVALMEMYKDYKQAKNHAELK